MACANISNGARQGGGHSAFAPQSAELGSDFFTVLRNDSLNDCLLARISSALHAASDIGGENIARFVGLHPNAAS